MKFKATRNELLAGLDKVSSAVSTRTVLPVLANILINVDVATSKVHLMATDLELVIACSLDAEVSEGGTLTLPAVTLTDWVESLPEAATVSIEQVADTKVLVKSGRARCTLIGLSADDFPNAPKFNEANAFFVDAGILAEAFGKTAFSTSTDAVRYLLNGLNVVVKEGQLTVVALDGKRMAMAVRALALKGVVPTMQTIMPNKAVKEYLGTFGKATGDIQCELNASRIAFRKGDTVLISRVIEGVFPEYAHVLTRNVSASLVLARAEFGALIKRASLSSPTGAATITLVLSKGTLSATSTAEGRVVMEDDIPVDYNGATITVSLSSVSILDVLKTTDTDKVTLEFGAPNAPFVIRPEGDKNTMWLVMPIIVNNVMGNRVPVATVK
jgi:DNA polymerase-3 subunit beta